MPEVVRAKAVAAGEVGRRWVEELPEVLAGLADRWQVVIGAPLSGGTAGFVARTTTAAGAAAVVKVAVPDPGFGRQVRTLVAARGRGYVRLLAQDLDHGAVLLEALGVSLDRTGLTSHAQLSTLAAMLPVAWAVPPAAGDAVQDKAAGLAELVERLWQQLGQPCTRRAVDYALGCARRRSAGLDPDRCVVVHGDAAPANALRVVSARPGAETGFVFVDPDGFLADPAYDLGVAVRDWCPQLRAAADPTRLLRQYCEVIANGSGADPVAVWEWGYLERLSTGLYALRLGVHDLAQPFLTKYYVTAHADEATPDGTRLVHSHCRRRATGARSQPALLYA